MKIAITADPELPVPPRFYGGIERIIDLLVRGLVERGHELTLFANAESAVPCAVVPYPGAKSSSVWDSIRNSTLIARHVVGGGFDLVHSFGRVAYLLPLLPLRLPKLMTYQRAIAPRSISWGNHLSRGTLHWSAISHSMVADVSHIADWHIVYNGVPLDAYDYSPSTDDDAPLMFLGRIEPIKGAHLAIQVALASNRRLVMAGNVPESAETYFRNEIRPHLDGQRVTHVGPVDDAMKNHLLGRAAALLMPVLWEEPFGIVMAEALACGTPVIGLRRGAVPEVVESGVTGFVCDDVEGMVESVGRIGSLDRQDCRNRAARLFSGQAIVDGYTRVYARMLGG